MERKFFAWLFVLTGEFWKASSTQSKVDRYPEQKDLRCDFKFGNCFWQEDPSARFSWQNARGQTSKESGPRTDFSFFSTEKHYILFQTHVKKGPYRAVMSTPPISTSNEHSCFTFGYFMQGAEVGGLRVWKRTGNFEKTLLFSIFGPQGSRWYQAFVPIGVGENFTLEIEGTYQGERGLGNIAIDDTDVRLNADSCVQNVNYEPRFDCDFDSKYFCSWHAEGNWVGGSPADGWGSGHFMYRHRGWTRQVPSHLASRTISVLGQGACFSFNYFIHNPLTLRTALNVYSYGRLLEDGGREIWSAPIIHPRVDKTSVTIPPGENIYLVFFVKSSFRKRETLQFDDFKLSYKGPCQSDGSDPEQKKIYRCDFDTNTTCEWFQRSLPLTGRWKTHQGPTPSEGTGPDKDHTSGDGHYVYLESSKVDIAQLYSPIVDIPAQGACFSFWYHMYGEDINQLTVWRYNHSAFLEAERKRVLWKTEGNQGDRWIQENITLSEAPGHMSIVLEAQRGYFPTGDIAIDDVVLSLDGPCYGDSLIPEVVATEATSAPVSSSDTISPDTTKSTTTSPAPVPRRPKIRVTGEINPAPVGSTVRLECGETSDIVQWKFASPMSRFRGRTSVTGPRIIHFEEIQSEDENVFTCQVLKGHGFIQSKPVQIKVVQEQRARPQLISYDLLNPAVIGSKVTLQCGDGAEGASYMWTFTTSDTMSNYTTESRFTVLEHVTSDNDGSYRCCLSKNGLHTAMSNIVKINVVKGRLCQADEDCSGRKGYTGDCYRRRCRCVYQELLRDSKCLVKPPRPRINVVQPHLMYGVGETINLKCTSIEPLYESASYHFLRNGIELTRVGGSDRFYVYSISNASISDSGDYTCLVKYGGVSSETSDDVSIQIKDFIDLNCGFDEDLCNWFHEDNSKMFLFEPSLTSHDSSLKSSAAAYLLSSGFQGALLRSPDIKVNYFKACLNFRYRMDSEDATSLSVWIYKHSEISDEPSTGRNVWSAVGNQGADWKEASIKVQRETDFYILFQGQGRIAIDNFQYSIHGDC